MLKTLLFRKSAEAPPNATLLVERVKGGDWVSSGGYDLHADALLLKDSGALLVARRLSWALGKPRQPVEFGDGVALECAKLWAEDELFPSGGGAGSWHVRCGSLGPAQGVGRPSEPERGLVIGIGLILSRLAPQDTRNGEAVYQHLDGLMNILFGEDLGRP